MIFENRCLFLFEKDLMPDFRGISIKDLDLRMFQPKDNEAFQKYLRVTSLAIYVDTDNRVIFYLSGNMKGRIEKY